MLRSRVSATASRIVALAGALMLCSTVASAAVIYEVTVDTSAFAGDSGFLDFQFNGLGAADAATAVVSSFSGGTLVGVPTLTGSVTGALPGPVTFENNAALTSYLQEFMFGTAFQFYLTIDGDAINNPSGSGAETFFSLSLYNSDLTGTLGPADPLLGSAGYVRIAADGTLDPQAAGPDAIVTFREVDTLVPEPSTWFLSSGALLALAASSRMRGASRRVRT